MVKKSQHLLITVFLFSALSGFAGGQTTTQARPVEVTMLFPATSPTFYGYWVAAELGYYEEEGLDVTFNPVDGGRTAVRQLIAGNGDFAHAPIPVVGEALEQGFTEIRALFNIIYGSNCYVSVPATSDINAVADLQGKKIGVTDLSGGEVPTVLAMLKSAGIAEEEVNLVTVGEGTALAYRALDEGMIDAFGGCVPDFLSIEAQGLDLRPILPEELAALPGAGIYTTQGVIDDKGEEVVVGFLRATAKGYDFGHFNDDATIEVLKKAMPERFTDESGENIFRSVLVRNVPPGSIVRGEQTADGWRLLFEFLEIAVPDVDLTTIVNEELVKTANEYDRGPVEADAQSYQP
jgi:ABC-type nitrate/sulfonate/bicarbonate transport system substrate-binding protein